MMLELSLKARSYFFIHFSNCAGIIRARISNNFYDMLTDRKSGKRA
jgi:hypothetical protein